MLEARQKHLSVMPFQSRKEAPQLIIRKMRLRPESLLPMRLGETQVRDSIRRWYGSRWFAPNKLKDAALTDTARLALAKYLELTREFLWLAGWDRHHAMFGEILAEVASGAKGSEIGSVSACVKLFLAQSVMSAMNGEEGEAQE